MTDKLMKFDPAYGTERPYPSHAEQFRIHHGRLAWLFNPWTGDKRHPYDIGSDPFGNLITAPGDALIAAAGQMSGGSLGNEIGRQQHVNKARG